MKYKVLIPQEVSVKAINYLEANDCECICLHDCSVENMCKYVGDCDAILARTADFNQVVLEKGIKLKIVARHGAGLDNIDLDYAREKGIVITNTPGANSNSVAEHTIALMLACAKNIPYFDKITREGDWVKRDTEKTIDVSGKTLGLIGFGRISGLVAKKAALGFDMNVLVYRTHRDTPLPEYIQEAENMEEVLSQSDFVSFHMPLRPDTENIINKETLGLMKESAYFINMARGGNVDEDALYDILKSHKIAGAAIDVFKMEPPGADNKLFELDNLIVSPHNAAHSYDSMDRMAYNAATEIIKVLNGKKPQWQV
ncbi:MAG: hydroxyacid dehydrogenase [Eubacterium sp.]|jgi:D-3-phosphoglycerate dehydrogenase|nr:hydroxyacid dehydrogenase [Eubacterium sp.]